MHINTVGYIIKEGVKNAFKNSLMSAVSIITSAVTLFLFGCALITAFNLEYNAKKLDEAPELTAYCEPELDQFQIDQIEDTIKEIEGIRETAKLSKEDAYNRTIEILGENSEILSDFGNDFFPVSFVIRLKSSNFAEQVKSQLIDIQGIYKVNYSEPAVDFAKSVTGWVNIISIVIVAGLALICIMLISNTIKLTVLSRQKEIAIMKYVGATDGLIRWPFIIEGLLIGAIGAAIALIVTCIGYNSLVHYINESNKPLTQTVFEFIEISDFDFFLVASYTLLGTGVGLFGSTFSLRKYLKV